MVIQEEKTVVKKEEKSRSIPTPEPTKQDDKVVILINNFPSFEILLIDHMLKYLIFSFFVLTFFSIKLINFNLEHKKFFFVILFVFEKKKSPLTCCNSLFSFYQLFFARIINFNVTHEN